MNKIIVLSFPLIVFCLFSLFYYIHRHKIVSAELEKIAHYKRLIMGDSQMQRLKPDWFDDSTFNFASSGEHYYFTFQKLNKILSIQNHNIQQIILGVSAHNFAPVYCRLFNVQYPEGKASLTKYLYFIDPMNNDFITKGDALSKGFIEGIYKEPDWGGLMISESKNPDSSIIHQIYNLHFEIKYKEGFYSLEQFRYLFSIDSLCHIQHIDLIVVSLPYCDQYLSMVDSSYLNLLNRSLEGMNNAKYINYIYHQIDPQLMSDAVHLNSTGSDKYSKMINDTVKNYP